MDPKQTLDSNTAMKQLFVTISCFAHFVFVPNCWTQEVEPQRMKISDIVDGPHVTWTTPTTAEVVSFVGGKVTRKVYSEITQPKEIIVPGPPESRILLDPAQPTPPKSVWPAPKRMMAISDLEGNYRHTIRFLKINKIIDESGKWAWGDGHLVLVGDLVDRGYEVTELMWLLRRLDREAKAAGGHLHYILGNHEAMVMAGDLRYVHPKYGFTSAQMKTTYDKLYGANTDIGRWWRSKNTVEVIGDILFVHGGYSPMLEEAKLTPEQLNKRIRECLPPSRVVGRTVAENPVAHMLGPFWYRGYFAEYAASFGGKTPPAEVRRILTRHKARYVVVGHTVVDKVGFVDGSPSVIGIDVKWASSKGEGLLVEDGNLFRVTMTGQRSALHP